MKQFIKLVSWGSVIAVFLIMLSTPSQAQDSPVKITLMADQSQYIQGDPIQIQIRVFNENYNQASGTIEPVITREGFFTQDYQHLITFIGPDGKPIKSNYAMIDPEPGPPYRVGGRDLVDAEIIPPDGDNTYVLDDAKEYYSILQPGWYEAQIRVPFDVFAEYITDAAGDILSDLKDPDNESFNPLASNKIYFEIVAPQVEPESSIHVNANLLTIGSGSQPDITATPIEGMTVKLFPISSIPKDYYPIDFKTYSIIWGNATSVKSAITDADGVAKFEGVDQDDYLILGHYPQGQSFDYLAGRVWADDSRWDLEEPIIIERLVAFETADGDSIACRIFRFTGSELLIYEPEFVVWDSREEYYPIVFEAEGNWEVKTSVTPSAGFSADRKLIKVNVVDELKAIQFKIIEKGGRWKETRVTYKIKNKKDGINVKLVSTIGVILDQRLARQEGSGRYGDTGEPGPFKGGRKIKKEENKNEEKIENNEEENVEAKTKIEKRRKKRR
jgi:hypothetical protein